MPFGPHLCRDAVDDEALRPVGRLLQLTKPLSDQWLVVSAVGVNILGGGEGRGEEGKRWTNYHQKNRTIHSKVLPFQPEILVKIFSPDEGYCIAAETLAFKWVVLVT